MDISSVTSVPAVRAPVEQQKPMQAPRAAVATMQPDTVSISTAGFAAAAYAAAGAGGSKNGHDPA